jgi:beta-phosphoglucomutase-like phosphatase (HAD superfamily)
VSGEDFPKSKPDPAILYTLLLYPSLLKQIVLIEDSTNGVRAAKAAGIYCVGYNSIHSKAQDLSEADVIINHFAELNFEKLHLFNPN